MTRLIPYPLLAAALLLMWLLLTQSFSPGQVILGGIVAVAATHATAAIRPRRARVRSISAVAKLLGLVLMDIARSNFAVAAIVLGRRSDRVSGFVRFPLELRDHFGLTTLALIITATPGTMWVEYNGERGELLVHVLDLIDEEEWISLIKRRYETLLLEIFGS